MGVFSKLLEVQKKVNKLQKNSESGDVKFSYKYLNGDKLLSHIKPEMNCQGLILKQEIVKVDKELINYKTKNAEKTEMLYSVVFKFTWVDVETGEKDENEFFASGMNGFDKGLGSAITYAERYFIMKYFHIATDEDDVDKSNEIKEPNINKAEIDRILFLENLIIKSGSSKEDVANYYNFESISEINKEKIEELIIIFKKRVEKKAVA